MQCFCSKGATESANAEETEVSCEFAVTDRQTEAARISPDRTAYVASGIGVPPNPKKGGNNKVGVRTPNHKSETRQPQKLGPGTNIAKPLPGHLTISSLLILKSVHYYAS